MCKCRLNKCCCFDLRIGTLIIAWFTLICAVLWLALTIYDSLREGVLDGGVFLFFESANVILDVITVIFIFLGIYKANVKFIWVSAYVLLASAIWYLVEFLALFILGYHWLDGIALVIIFPIKIYFFVAVRSYAYQVSSLDHEKEEVNLN